MTTTLQTQMRRKIKQFHVVNLPRFNGSIAYAIVVGVLVPLVGEQQLKLIKLSRYGGVSRIDIKTNPFSIDTSIEENVEYMERSLYEMIDEDRQVEGSAIDYDRISELQFVDIKSKAPCSEIMKPKVIENKISFPFYEFAYCALNLKDTIPIVNKSIVEVQVNKDNCPVTFETHQYPIGTLSVHIEVSKKLEFVSEVFVRFFIKIVDHLIDEKMIGLGRLSEIELHESITHLPKYNVTNQGTLIRRNPFEYKEVGNHASNIEPQSPSIESVLSSNRYEIMLDIAFIEDVNDINRKIAKFIDHIQLEEEPFFSMAYLNGGSSNYIVKGTVLNQKA